MSVAAVFYPLPPSLLQDPQVEYMRECFRHQHALGNAIVAQDVLALASMPLRDIAARGDQATLRGHAASMQIQMLSLVDEAWFYIDTGLTDQMWAGIRAAAALGRRVILVFLRNMTPTGLLDVRAVAMEVEGVVFRRGEYHALITYLDDPQVGEVWATRAPSGPHAIVRGRARVPNSGENRLTDLLTYTMLVDGVSTLYARPFTEFVQRYKFLEVRKAGRGGKDGHSQ